MSSELKSEKEECQCGHFRVHHTGSRGACTVIFGEEIEPALCLCSQFIASIPGDRLEPAETPDAINYVRAQRDLHWQQVKNLSAKVSEEEWNEIFQRRDTGRSNWSVEREDIDALISKRVRRLSDAEKGPAPVSEAAQQQDGRASSVCPLCGIDSPHAHTKHELIHRFRTERLQQEFERSLDEWFARYKDILPGSHGMGIFLNRKSDSPLRKYWWWLVEMQWEAFTRGAYSVAPLINGRDEVPQMHEALQIKADPFAAQQSAPIPEQLLADFFASDPCPHCLTPQEHLTKRIAALTQQNAELKLERQRFEGAALDAVGAALQDQQQIAILKQSEADLRALLADRDAEVKRLTPPPNNNKPGPAEPPRPPRDRRVR